MENEVAILMATYNGEEYLEEQIESILSQTYKNWVLYIRDDNSTDNTQKIIDKYVKLYPEKIFQIKDDLIVGGACKNFMCILENVHKNYRHKMYMFCDQDDVWLKDKIEITVNRYLKQEDKEKPILIHTDLYVVDEKLKLISTSCVKYLKLREDYKNFNSILIQNNARGCTVLINDKLADLVKYNIKTIEMHDWYFALITSAFGKIIFINEQTIKYRQHSNNVVGATAYIGFKNIYKRTIRVIQKYIVKRKKNNFAEPIFKQAESFRELYYNMLDENKKKIIDEFCSIQKSSKIKKIYKIIRYKFYRQGLVRIIHEILFI